MRGLPQASAGEADMTVKVILEPSEDGGYTAVVPALPGCISEGATREEALRNIREAIELYLEPVEDDALVSPASEQVELTL
jgi:predicted RNase H-like HicB family nuclease